MSQTDSNGKFRLVDEDESPASAIVLRPEIGSNTENATPPRVARKPLSPPTEPGEPETDVPHRLPAGAQPLKRTHEPDVEILYQPHGADTPSTEDAWEKPVHTQHRSIPVGWIILACVLAASALIWSLRAWMTGNQKVIRTEQAAGSLIDQEEQDKKEASMMIDAIDAAVRGYFRCTSVDELRRFVRHPERVAPLMHQHYKNQPVFIGTVQRIVTMRPLNIDHRRKFWVVAAVLSNGHKPLITVDATDPHHVLIDWESLVCYQAMDWTTYVETRPAGSTMDFRVYAEPVNFHSHEFKDPKEWLCVRLTAHNSDEFLFGYAKIHSETGSKLRELIKKNHLEPTTLTLRLTLPAGTESPRGVVIDRVLTPGWIYLEPPP